MLPVITGIASGTLNTSVGCADGHALLGLVMTPLLLITILILSAAHFHAA